MYKIFFNRTEILLLEHPEHALKNCQTLLNLKDITPDFLSELLLSYSGSKHKICFLCPFPTDCLKNFSSLFDHIEAAGGLVANRSGQLLLIKRNGIWDLPKGKREHGEDIATTAIREVSEETGISHIEVHGLFEKTYHIYNTYGPWTMKTTYWFAMTTSDRQLVPQTEEGIEKVIFATREEVEQYQSNMYPLVYELATKFFDREK